jgi:hypothetical protein
METEPDDRFYETSFSHDGIYDQFILFIMDESGIEYPKPEPPKYYSPEVAHDGRW